MNSNIHNHFADPSPEATAAAIEIDDSDLFPLTVVVITHNEEINIARCLESVQWCDELIVIDDHSTDATADVAARCGATVVEHRFESFSRQRNFALEKLPLRNEWVLMLDADEAITPALRRQIEERIPEASSDVVAYRMCRKTMYLGKWLKYSDGFPVWIMRLVRKNGLRFADHGHGEIPVPETEGEIATLSEPFLHFPFSHGIGHWVRRHVDYAAREAALESELCGDWRWVELFSRDKSRRRSAQRLFSRRLPLRPVLRFAYQYFLKLGFLDGRAGLTFSSLMAFYEGLIVQQRRELKQQQDGELL